MDAQSRQSELIANRSMPPGIIIPELVYSDVGTAVAWLCETFGFSERLRIGNHRSQLVFGEASVILVAQSGAGAPQAPNAAAFQPAQGELTHSVMVRIADVDRHYEQVRQRGATILHPPETYPFGERQYTVEDLGGHRWTFTQSVADIAPEEWGGQPGRTSYRQNPMGSTDLHLWDLAPEVAMRVQAGLRPQLILQWDGRPVTTIGGVDVSTKEGLARAAIVVLRYPDLIPLEGVTAQAPLLFPYIPGLLAFREGPAVLAAWEALRVKPDMLMFDGQGIAHPRGIGIAAHIGLWLERPSIGVAKTRLYGRHADPGPGRGDQAPLFDERDGERAIGAVLRTREKTNPLYISPGHLIDIEHSVAFVLDCVAQHRLPEPTRWAHRVAGGEKLPSETGSQARLF